MPREGARVALLVPQPPRGGLPPRAAAAPAALARSARRSRANPFPFSDSAAARPVETALSSQASATPRVRAEAVSERDADERGGAALSRRSGPPAARPLGTELPPPAPARPRRRAAAAAQATDFPAPLLPLSRSSLESDCPLLLSSEQASPPSPTAAFYIAPDRSGRQGK